MKVLKNIIIFALYALLTILFGFIINYNECLEMSGAHFFILIFIRSSKLNALRKLNPYFHGNPLKYSYQKKDNLQGYQNLMKRIEIVVLIVAVVLAIIGFIVFF